MEAHELMIGNYVLKDNNITTVNTGLIAYIFYNGLKDRFKPIPLTEQWLKDFGFEEINHINGYSFHSLSKSKNNKCHLDVYDNYTKYYGYSVNHCQYVHQLQNLYFTLTGKQLKKQ